MTAVGSAYDAEAFLRVLSWRMPDEERLILCGFPGDPNEAPPTAWRPRPWRTGREVAMPEEWNGYVTVSSFLRSPDGSFRRRTDGFAAGRALMVDDVGTKVPLSAVEHVPPTAVIETSPGNFQWWYVLREPEHDRAKFDRAIRGFIYSKLLGNDPGMNGVNRVGRIPGYHNGKKAAKGWRVKMHYLAGNARSSMFNLDGLVKAFGIPMQGTRPEDMPNARLLASEDRAMRMNAWLAAMRRLRQMGLLKRGEADPSGWWEMRCPWLEEHTSKADTGAAVRMPEEENGWYGAFRCHHGHCADRGFRDLTDWIEEGDAIAAFEANARASEFDPSNAQHTAAPADAS